MLNRLRGTTLPALVACVALVSVTAACSSSSSSRSATTSSSSATSAPAADVLGPSQPATGTPITIGLVTDGAAASFGSDAAEVATFEGTIKYANERLGGLNGHPIVIHKCATNATPTGGTQCAVDLANAKVAAALVPVSAEDGTVFKGLAGSGIPYFTDSSADSGIILKPGAFLITNPISEIAAPGLIAQKQGIKKVGFIIIDVPAATGPISAIAKPIYAKLGVDLQIIPISPSVADMTPQLQQAISGGAGLFSVTGTDQFNISGVNGLRQLGFTGPVALGDPSPTVRKSLKTFDHFFGEGVQSDATTDKDVQLFHAVTSAYTSLQPGTGDERGFTTALGFVRALTGATSAVDAPSISAALAAMPAPVPLPLGGGINFQCGAKYVSFATSICSKDVLSWSYDAKGNRTNTELLSVPASALTLG